MKQGLDRRRHAQARRRDSRPRPARRRRHRLHPRLSRLVVGSHHRAVGAHRETDKIAALDAGADDYLTKPFGVGELLARVRATRRRSAGAASEDAAPFRFGDVEVDLARRTVRKADAPLHLTPIEYRLLALMITNAGRVLTHRQILREVWGPAYVEHEHYVRVHMGHLRRKIEDDPAQPKLSGDRNRGGLSVGRLTFPRSLPDSSREGDVRPLFQSTSDIKML